MLHRKVFFLMMIETSPPDLQLQSLIPQERNKNEPASVRALAKGVLRQAAKDLRAFHDAQESTGRELYRDAYSWVVSNDLSWPYSFVNVCEALGLSAEFVRAELLADTPPGWYLRSRRMAQTLSSSLRTSLANVFAARSSFANSRRSSRPVLVH
jgi:hypothetical protein